MSRATNVNISPSIMTKIESKQEFIVMQDLHNNNNNNNNNRFMMLFQVCEQ